MSNSGNKKFNFTGCRLEPSFVGYTYEIINENEDGSYTLKFDNDTTTFTTDEILDLINDQAYKLNGGIGYGNITMQAKYNSENPYDPITIDSLIRTTEEIESNPYFEGKGTKIINAPVIEQQQTPVVTQPTMPDNSAAGARLCQRKLNGTNNTIRIDSKNNEFGQPVDIHEDNGTYTVFSLDGEKIGTLEENDAYKLVGSVQQGDIKVIEQSPILPSKTGEDSKGTPSVASATQPKTVDDKQTTQTQPVEYKSKEGTVETKELDDGRVLQTKYGYGSASTETTRGRDNSMNHFKEYDSDGEVIYEADFSTAENGERIIKVYDEKGNSTEYTRTGLYGTYTNGKDGRVYKWDPAKGRMVVDDPTKQQTQLSSSKTNSEVTTQVTASPATQTPASETIKTDNSIPHIDEEKQLDYLIGMKDGDTVQVKSNKNGTELRLEKRNGVYHIYDGENQVGSTEIPLNVVNGYDLSNGINESTTSSPSTQETLDSKSTPQDSTLSTETQKDGASTDSKQVPKTLEELKKEIKNNNGKYDISMKKGPLSEKFVEMITNNETGEEQIPKFEKPLERLLKDVKDPADLLSQKSDSQPGLDKANQSVTSLGPRYGTDGWEAIHGESIPKYMKGPDGNIYAVEKSSNGTDLILTGTDGEQIVQPMGLLEDNGYTIATEKEVTASTNNATPSAKVATSESTTNKGTTIEIKSKEGTSDVKELGDGRVLQTEYGYEEAKKEITRASDSSMEHFKEYDSDGEVIYEADFSTAENGERVIKVYDEKGDSTEYIRTGLYGTYTNGKDGRVYKWDPAKGRMVVYDPTKQQTQLSSTSKTNPEVTTQVTTSSDSTPTQTPSSETIKTDNSIPHVDEEVQLDYLIDMKDGDSIKVKSNRDGTELRLEKRNGVYHIYDGEKQVGSTEIPLNVVNGYDLSNGINESTTNSPSTQETPPATSVAETGTASSQNQTSDANKALFTNMDEKSRIELNGNDGNKYHATFIRESQTIIISDENGNVVGNYQANSGDINDLLSEYTPTSQTTNATAATGQTKPQNGLTDRQQQTLQSFVDDKETFITGLMEKEHIPRSKAEEAFEMLKNNLSNNPEQLDALADAKEGNLPPKTNEPTLTTFSSGDDEFVSKLSDEDQRQYNEDVIEYKSKHPGVDQKVAIDYARQRLTERRAIEQLQLENRSSTGGDLSDDKIQSLYEESLNNGTTYSLDENANLIIETPGEDGQVREQKFDSEGKHLGETIKIDGKVVSSTTYSYNEDNTITITTKRDTDIGREESTITAYDDGRSESHYVLKNKEGETIETHDSVRQADGSSTTTIIKGDNTSIIDTDSKGRTTKVVEKESGETVKKTEIEYLNNGRKETITEKEKVTTITSIGSSQGAKTITTTVEGNKTTTLTESFTTTGKVVEEKVVIETENGTETTIHTDIQKSDGTITKRSKTIKENTNEKIVTEAEYEGSSDKPIRQKTTEYNKQDNTEKETIIEGTKVTKKDSKDGLILSEEEGEYKDLSDKDSYVPSKRKDYEYGDDENKVTTKSYKEGKLSSQEEETTRKDNTKSVTRTLYKDDEKTVKYQSTSSYKANGTLTSKTEEATLDDGKKITMTTTYGDDKNPTQCVTTVVEKGETPKTTTIDYLENGNKRTTIVKDGIAVETSVTYDENGNETTKVEQYNVDANGNEIEGTRKETSLDFRTKEEIEADGRAKVIDFLMTKNKMPYQEAERYALYIKTQSNSDWKDVLAIINPEISLEELASSESTDETPALEDSDTTLTQDEDLSAATTEVTLSPEEQEFQDYLDYYLSQEGHKGEDPAKIRAAYEAAKKIKNPKESKYGTLLDQYKEPKQFLDPKLSNIKDLLGDGNNKKAKAFVDFLKTKLQNGKLFNFETTQFEGAASQTYQRLMAELKDKANTLTSNAEIAEQATRLIEEELIPALEALAELDEVREGLRKELADLKVKYDAKLAEGKSIEEKIEVEYTITKPGTNEPEKDENGNDKKGTHTIDNPKFIEWCNEKAELELQIDEILNQRQVSVKGKSISGLLALDSYGEELSTKCYDILGKETDLEALIKDFNDSYKEDDGKKNNGGKNPPGGGGGENPPGGGGGGNPPKETPKLPDNTQEQMNYYQDLTPTDLSGIVDNLQKFAETNNLSLQELLFDEKNAKKLVEYLGSLGIFDDELKKLIKEGNPVKSQKLLRDIFTGKKASVMGLNVLTQNMIKTKLNDIATKNNIPISDLLGKEENMSLIKSELSNYQQINKNLSAINKDNCSEELTKICDGEDVEKYSGKSLNTVKDYIKDAAEEKNMSVDDYINSEKAINDINNLEKTSLLLNMISGFDNKELLNTLNTLVSTDYSTSK
ncbi:MAG: hypothetical protein IKQ33_04995 [Clostridia bacterium]|nr:hypothetical protein [Clostridia bacterium]